MLVKMFEASTTTSANQSLNGQDDLINRSDRTVLSIANAAGDSNCVVFLPDALNLSCALIRQGISQVIIAHAGDRHPAAKVNLAVVPDAQSYEFLGQVILQARRMLMPLSTFIIRIKHDRANGLSLSGRRLLVSHGFSVTRARAVNGDVISQAEMSLCRQPTCA